MQSNYLHRIIAWLAAKAGLAVFTPAALKTLRDHAYYDGWHDAESRAAAQGPCDVAARSGGR